VTVAVSLFAGGLDGFDHAARRFGVEPLGIEWDDAACATRAAGLLRTLQADVATINPAGMGSVDLLIGTPPCQAFSTAGNGEGRRALDAYRHAIRRMGDHQPVDAGELDRVCGDPRGHLVLEPLRWALALRPRWIALEQVPTVLPLWEATAQVLRAHGYSAWTGVLSAERYGVPQTRKRAFLAASLTGLVSEPPATHQRYVAPTRRDEETLGLFDAPEPERIVLPEDRDLEPWASMADALGWDAGDRATRHLSDDGWPWQRPATTLAGDPRVFPPGGHLANDGRDNTRMVGRPEGAVRVTLREALTLQSFDPDLPVQGSRTKQFEQVGNAVPPPLAHAVLQALGVAS
jgi:DNA (cytosine-5)-methyltransferase 1